MLGRASVATRAEGATCFQPELDEFDVASVLVRRLPIEEVR